jgi:dipeptidase
MESQIIFYFCRSCKPKLSYDMIRKIFLNSLFSMAILAIFHVNVNSCTNFLITKGASADGSTMISYSADSHLLYGELYFWPSADYQEGSLLDVYEWDTGKFLGKIKQVTHTYSVVGNMNENQVSIGETTYGGREELLDTTAIVDYGSLIYITLQRAKTARDAIKIMTDLVAEYGYASEGESFSIGDPNEVWILEMIGKGTVYGSLGKGKKKQTVNINKGAVWVAIRIPDGYISGHANQARIRQFPLNDPENCLFAADVIKFAKAKGFYKGEDKDFSFRDAYAPLTFEALRFCEARVWSGFRKFNSQMDKYLDYALGYNPDNVLPLYVKPDKKISVKDMMSLMRDHFEGTPLDMTVDIGAGPFHNPYRWRPLTYVVDSVEYCNERAISTQQTGFVFVSQMRNFLPNPVGGIHWFGVDDAASTVFTPMYCGITKVPEPYKVGNGSLMEFTENSAFWIFNMISNFAYTAYSRIHPDIAIVQAELENKYLEETKTIDKEAADLYKKDADKARQYLTEYSVNQGNNTFHRWKELYGSLFIKFMDGNIKTKKTLPANYKFVNPDLKQPGYSPEFYRTIIDQTKDHLKVKPLKGEIKAH